MAYEKEAVTRKKGDTIYRIRLLKTYYIPYQFFLVRQLVFSYAILINSLNRLQKTSTRVEYKFSLQSSHRYDSLKPKHSFLNLIKQFYYEDHSHLYSVVVVEVF